MKIGTLKIISGNPYWHYGAKVSVILNRNREYQSTKYLSSGQKAIVSLSIILALMRNFRFPILLLDEVDAALDVANVGLINSILCNRMGPTQVIFVSHRFQLGTRLSARNLILIQPKFSDTIEGNPIVGVNIRNSADAGEVRALFFKDWKQKLREENDEIAQNQELRERLRLQDLQDIALRDYRDELGLSSDQEVIIGGLNEMDDGDLQQCARVIHIFHRKLVPRMEQLGLLDAQLSHTSADAFPSNFPDRLNPLQTTEENEQKSQQYLPQFDFNDGGGDYQASMPDESIDNSINRSLSSGVDSQSQQSQISGILDGRDTESLIRQKIDMLVSQRRQFISQQQLNQIQERIYQWVKNQMEEQLHWNQQNINNQYLKKQKNKQKHKAQKKNKANREQMKHNGYRFQRESEQRIQKFRKPFRSVNLEQYIKLMRLEGIRETQQITHKIKKDGFTPTARFILNKQELKIVKKERTSPWKILSFEQSEEKDENLKLFSHSQIEERSHDYSVWLQGGFGNIFIENPQNINPYWVKEVGSIFSEMLIDQNSLGTSAAINYQLKGKTRLTHQELIACLTGDLSAISYLPPQFQALFKNVRHLMASIIGPNADISQLIAWKGLQYYQELKCLTKFDPESFLGGVGIVREAGMKGVSIINFFEMNANPSLFFQRELYFWEEMMQLSEQSKIPQITGKMTLRLFSVLISPVLCSKALLSTPPQNLPISLQQVGYFLHFLKEFNYKDAKQTLSNSQFSRILQKQPPTFSFTIKNLIDSKKVSNNRDFPKISHHEYVKSASLKYHQQLKQLATLHKNNYLRNRNKRSAFDEQIKVPHEESNRIRIQSNNFSRQDQERQEKQFEQLANQLHYEKSKTEESGSQHEQNQRVRLKLKYEVQTDVYLNCFRINKQDFQVVEQQKLFITNCAIQKLPRRNPINWNQLSSQETKENQEEKHLFQRFREFGLAEAQSQFIEQILGIQNNEEVISEDSNLDLDQMNAQLLKSQEQKFIQAMRQEMKDSDEERKIEHSLDLLMMDAQQKILKEKVGILKSSSKQEDKRCLNQKGKYDSILQDLFNQGNESTLDLKIQKQNTKQEMKTSTENKSKKINPEMQTLVKTLKGQAKEVEREFKIQMFQKKRQIKAASGKKAQMDRDLGDIRDMNYLEDEWKILDQGDWRKENFIKETEFQRANYLYWMIKDEESFFQRRRDYDG